MYDWRKAPTDTETTRLSSYDYEDQLRQFDRTKDGNEQATSQCCAIGFSGISCHINGIGDDAENWIYMNNRSTKDYKANLAAGKFPVERGFMYSSDDVRIGWLFQSMQTMTIDCARYQALFNEDINAEFSSIWTDIQSRGWIERSQDRIAFVGDGQYYIPISEP